MLEPSELDVGDEATALAGWSDQVRRQTRTLREEHAALREEQVQLRRRAVSAREQRTDTADGR